MTPTRKTLAWALPMVAAGILCAGVAVARLAAPQRLTPQHIALIRAAMLQADLLTAGNNSKNRAHFRAAVAALDDVTALPSHERVQLVTAGRLLDGESAVCDSARALARVTGDHADARARHAKMLEQASDFQSQCRRALEAHR